MFYSGKKLKILGKPKSILLADQLFNKTFQTLFIDLSIIVSYTIILIFVTVPAPICR